MIRFLFRLVFKAVSFVVLVGVAFLAYHLYTTGRLPYLQRAVQDTAVTGSVKAAFAVHRELSERPIDVTTRGGVVTLSGNVASETERDIAVELASTVEGVEDVDPRLEVVPGVADDEGAAAEKSLGSRLDDAALLTKIRTALHLDREARKIDIDVYVSDGNVMLRGEVPTEALADRIRTRVASVSGVQRLEDELRLEAQPD